MKGGFWCNCLEGWAPFNRGRVGFRGKAIYSVLDKVNCNDVMDRKLSRCDLNYKYLNGVVIKSERLDKSVKKRVITMKIRNKPKTGLWQNFSLGKRKSAFAEVSSDV